MNMVARVNLFLRQVNRLSPFGKPPKLVLNTIYPTPTGCKTN